MSSTWPLSLQGVGGVGVRCWRLLSFHEGKALTDLVKFTGNFFPRLFTRHQLMFYLGPGPSRVLHLFEMLLRLVSQPLETVPLHKFAGGFIEVLQIATKLADHSVVLLEQCQGDEAKSAKNGAAQAPEQGA